MDIVTLLGFAAVLTTGCFVPQAVKIIKSKHTEDISLGMYIALVLGISLWLTYGILLNAMLIILANVISLLFTSIILVMKIKYG